jgi:hypothetical protein
MDADQVRFLSNVAVALVQISLGAALAWAIGTRVAYSWDDQKRRRESDLVALGDFYRAYGLFYTTWSLWHTYTNEDRKFRVTWPKEIQSQLLMKAEEAEAAFETSL